MGMKFSIVPLMSDVQPYRILVVDDEPTNLLLLQVFLEQQGYQSQTATDGLRAVALMQHAPPDLVLLDLAMPRMNGYAVLQHMRQHPQLQAIPVIVTTAQDEEEVRYNNSLAGANHVISKPINLPRLLSTVQACCP